MARGGGFLGTLSDIGEIAQGYDRSGYNDILRQLAMEQLRQQRLQQSQQRLIGQGLHSNPSGLDALLGGGAGQIPMPPQSPQGGQQGPMPPQVPQTAGAMGGPQQLPPSPTMGYHSGNLTGRLGPGSAGMLPNLIAQMESSGGRDTASQPPSMVDKVYGQYGDFSHDYGTGEAGVNKFANAELRANPNATIGDYYSDYVLGTGKPGQHTPQDLASTTVPGAQGAYRNMETKLASAGISDATPLKTLMDAHQSWQQSNPPQVNAQADQLKNAAAGNIPNILQTAGRWSVSGLAKWIDTIDPTADPEVKAGAFLKLYPLLNEQAKNQAADIFKGFQEGEKIREFGETKALQKEEFGLRQQATAAQHEFNNLLALGKFGLQQQKFVAGQLPPDAVEVLADQGYSGDTSWKQNLGRGAQGAENIAAVQARIAEKLKEHGETGADLATREAEFGGLKAGERTLDIRTANIGMRINEAQRFAPLALAASDKVDRTQYKSLNQIENAWLEGTGDENVVKMMVYMQSFMNAYAAAVTPTGQPTEGAQARARGNLNLAWSQGQVRAAIEAMLVEMDQASKSPGVVREEFRSGVGAPAKGGSPITGPASGGIGGQDFMPLPPEHAQDPDGTGYRNKQTNEIWTKHGNQLVRTPGGEPAPQQ